MCGRFTLHTPFDQLAKRFKVKIPSNFEPSYNIAPGDRVLAIAINQPLKMQFFKWGLAPFWAKQGRIRDNLINARSETVEQKPVFVKTHRCLIPADGFFEWDKKQKPSQPYYIRLKNKLAFCFAALSQKSQESGVSQRNFAILTTESNQMLKKIHPRMPVILTGQYQDYWLDPKKSISDLKTILKPYSAQKMECYPVTSKMNHPGFDEPAAVERLGWQL
ncbi:MAG: hypothetical protein GF332_03330 [Candidatus Moranbacteria bacterium]|nr:hypothetical protein [Candidatus Moranbacteria bacterium]